MAETVSELRECPFCGESDRLSPGLLQDKASVFCAGCGTLGPASWGHDDNIPTAIAAWNRRPPSPDVGESRDARQTVVADWCVASFGSSAASSLPQRTVRLLEEVIETYQAAGGDPAMAHKLIDFVFARPVGELSQEIGGVGLVLLSLAAAAGVSADAEEAREVARVLAKPNSHWAARNANKNAAGFDTALLAKHAGKG